MTDSRCPSCQSADLTERRLLEDLRVLICGSCGLWIREPRPPAGNAHARVDVARFQRSIGVVRERQARTIVDRVRQFVPGGKWLDAGAGFGYALAEARRAGFEVEGLEPDAQAAAAARALLGSVKIAEEKFGSSAVQPVDVLSTLDVLEHVPEGELAGFASAVRASLRAGGVWAIKVPTTEGLYFRIGHALLGVARPLAAGFVRRLWQLDEACPHTVYFNRRSLTRFLQVQEFEVVSAEYLPEMPTGTVTDRLLVVDGIPGWVARLAAPFVVVIEGLERLRGKSDALFVIAKSRVPRPSP